MGFIEKRSGHYRARYRDPLGRQRSETFTRKADAERYLREMQVDIERGRWIDPAGASSGCPRADKARPKVRAGRVGVDDRRGRSGTSGCGAGRPCRAPWRPQAVPASSMTGVGMMRADELRAIQNPIKDRYRDDPKAAEITLEADGRLDEGIACSVATGSAIARAGLHPATGGDGVSLCSGDMLLQALVACAGVTLRAVATSLDIPVAGGTVRAEGDLDFRGTLAVSKDVPVGFRAIRLRFDLDCDATDEQLETLVRLTERYCVVYQTLALSPRLSVSGVRTNGGSTSP